jgi:hypothetical protein
MQMAQNIRRYKGVRPIPELRGRSRMQIDGDFADWRQVDLEYRDTVGDTFHRDYPGYGGLRYTNDSGRNDIVTSKVAVDGKTVYFYVETREPLTPHTDANWMLLLIDADQNHGTGWYGYDYLVNGSVLGETTTTLKRYAPNSGDGPWREHGRLDYRYADNSLELAVPRKMMHLKDKAFTFDFHWCDNPADLQTPISLCINGDSAPNRRFNYRCIRRK